MIKGAVKSHLLNGVAREFGEVDRHPINNRISMHIQQEEEPDSLYNLQTQRTGQILSH